MQNLYFIQKLFKYNFKTPRAIGLNIIVIGTTRALDYSGCVLLLISSHR